MAYIGNTPGENFISFSKQVFTIVNSQTAYSLDHKVTDENELRLVINNVVQEPGTGKAYTASGNTLTLASALTNGTDEMYCIFLGKARETSTVPDSFITKNKLNLISTSSSAGLEVKGDGSSQDGYLQLNCSQNSHGVKIKSPPHSAGQSYTLTLPSSITNDYYLKTDGSGNLSFSAVSSDWVKIAHTDVTSPVSSVDFVHGTGGVVLDSTYRYYKVLFTWRPSTNGAVLAVRVANSGTFRTSGYLAEVFRSYYSGGTSRTNSSTNILVGTGGTQNASDQRSNGEMTFYNMSDSSLNTTAQLLSVAIDGSGNTENQVNNQIGGGVYASPEAHNGIRIKVHSDNIKRGEFTLYGIKG